MRSAIKLRQTRTELFVCDGCGARSRLPSTRRHWCENCNYGTAVEMRPVRIAKYTSSVSKNLTGSLISGGGA